MIAVPILTYHAVNISGNAYEQNDHVALAADLELLYSSGARVVPLQVIADSLIKNRLADLRNCVGISLDDGSDFDAFDLPHPNHGVQRGMLGVLRDFRARHGPSAQPSLHATSFVIASPSARDEIDSTSLIGCKWMNDGWWSSVEASGLMSVENHSWDHNHDSLTSTACRAARGTFDIDLEADADSEISQATRYLIARRGRGGDVLFAYPYGPASAYLAASYFPTVKGHGVGAAFTTDGAPVSKGISRWRIPRYVCGWHWKNPDELIQLLKDAGTLKKRSPLRRLVSSWRPKLSHDESHLASINAPAKLGDFLRVWEVNEANKVAGHLFRESFPGHDVPTFPRHFVVVFSPPPGEERGLPRVVAYVHFTRQGNSYLCGGMCVEPSTYRALPKPVFEELRRAGGLATWMLTESFNMLGDCEAVFGHVGEPRARAADLRAGFVDTDRPHLMVVWRKPLTPTEQTRLIDEVEALGPF